MGVDAASTRQRMVDDLVRRGVCRSPEVELAMRTVERHLYLPERPVEEAYSDHAIVTKWGEGMALSSLSQPTIVATMLEMLQVGPGYRVLEVGSGTGYNAALLSCLVGPAGRVVTIELDEDVAERARAALAADGRTNVAVVVGDGRAGHPSGAPYGGVIVTAAAEAVAPAWRDQLRDGGRIVVPLSGERRAVAYRLTDGVLVEEATCPAAFVPLR